MMSDYNISQINPKTTVRVQSNEGEFCFKNQKFILFTKTM